MKLLCTADLHIGEKNSPQLRDLADYAAIIRPDVVVIAGDVFEHPLLQSRKFNVFDELSLISFPTVFCLGNHEFAYGSIDGTLATVRAMKANARRRCRAHCLDIDGRCDMEDEAGPVRFVGNVLWYDGSMALPQMSVRQMQSIDHRWLDSTIIGFEPAAENRRCVSAIKRNLARWHGRSVLVTHCCPHREMNTYIRSSPLSLYNCYSGMDDLFSMLPKTPDLSVCGHTHSMVNERLCGETIKARCVNIGNDYYHYTGYVRTLVLEV